MEIIDKKVLLQLIYGLTLSENTGDVTDEIIVALEEIGMEDLKWNDLGELGDELRKMGYGDDEDEDYDFVEEDYDDYDADDEEID